MDHDPTVVVLGSLLRREQGNMAPRLLESTVFISSWSARAQRFVRECADACLRHCEALTGVIRDLGGEPGPRSGDVRTADLHFLDLSVALPRWVAEHEALVESFRRGATQLGDRPEAAALVSRIADFHQDELERLRALLRREESPTV